MVKVILNIYLFKNILFYDGISMRKLILLNTVQILAILFTQQVHAHGGVSYPISRQSQCKDDGKFWGASSAIPNAGCRASFEKSGYYAFIQWNEGAANPNPRNNQAALEKAVPNGLLCAAGDKNKQGLDVPQNRGWKLTPIKAGTTFTHIWKLTAPHFPSDHRIYITKKDADFQNRELRWSDLDLDNPLYVGKMAPTTINPDGTAVYKTDIRIPADRHGKAMLYSIWQRDDAGNEAFLNCSDIDIQSSENEAKPVVTTTKPVVTTTQPTTNKPWKVPAGAIQIGEPISQPAVTTPKPSASKWKVPAGAIVGNTVYEPATRQYK